MGIEGFTDSVGGFSGNNIQLSYNRAMAVRDYLPPKGVPADKIYSKGNSVSFRYGNITTDGTAEQPSRGCEHQLKHHRNFL